MTTTCQTAKHLRNRINAAPFGTNEKARAKAAYNQHANTCPKCRAFRAGLEAAPGLVMAAGRDTSMEME